MGNNSKEHLRTRKTKNEFAEAKKEDKDKLHLGTDGIFETNGEMFSELIKNKCLDWYWKRFSELVENTWIEHMQVDKDTATTTERNRSGQDHHGEN